MKFKFWVFPKSCLLTLSLDCFLCFDTNPWGFTREYIYKTYITHRYLDVMEAGTHVFQNPIDLLGTHTDSIMPRSSQAVAWNTTLSSSSAQWVLWKPKCPRDGSRAAATKFSELLLFPLNPQKIRKQDMSNCSSEPEHTERRRHSLGPGMEPPHCEGRTRQGPQWGWLTPRGERCLVHLMGWKVLVGLRVRRHCIPG